MLIRTRLLVERSIMLALIGILLIALFFRSGGVQQNELASELADEYVTLARNAIPAVVSIAAQYDPKGETGSSGSGFIISNDGYIVTNVHVIRNASIIRATLTNKDIYQARVVGVDEPTDLALLKVDGSNLPTVTFGNSEELKVGEKVVAIGNPFGLESTITSGIVSAKNRDRGPTDYKDFIQTDTNINPGNSGGPLVNLKGEVVGINTFIVATAEAPGAGFAIPSDLAKRVISELQERGYVVRGFLGVRTTNVVQMNETTGSGKILPGAVVVALYDDGPAKAAGMQVNDIIRAVNNEQIIDSNHLKNVVAWIEEGKTVTVAVDRPLNAGSFEKKTFTVKIGKRPTVL